VQASEEDERVACHILATAEFCAETVEALAAACRKDVKVPSLADQVARRERGGGERGKGRLLNATSLTVEAKDVGDGCDKQSGLLLVAPHPLCPASVAAGLIRACTPDTDVCGRGCDVQLVLGLGRNRLVAMTMAL
jgi:hypothetical protein